MSIARKAAAGAAWNVGTGITLRAVGLVGTLLLTRFLAPDTYGEVSVAVVCVLMTARFMTLGVGSYVIAFRSPPSEVFEGLCYHCFCIGAGCLAVTLAREPLAGALGSPGMARYVPGIALATFISQASQVPSAMLARALQFRVIAVTRAAGELTYTVLSVALAPLMGGGSIVAGNLARSLVVTGTIFVRADRREWLWPARPRWATLKRILGYGVPVSLSSLSSALATSADNLLVSHLYGPTVMGQYNLAYNLGTMPSNQVAENIGDVLQPSFAKMDDPQRRAALPKTSSLMALVIFPLAIGLSVVAPTAVRALLDPRWAAVGPMLLLLATLSIPHPLTWVVGAYFAAIGRTRPFIFLGIVRLASVFGGILTLGRLGPLWACAAVALAFQLFGLVTLAFGVYYEKLDGGALIASVVRPLLASLVMVPAILIVRQLLVMAGVQAGIGMLAAEVATGAVVYLGGCTLFARESSLMLVRLGRGTLEKRSAA